MEELKKSIDKLSENVESLYYVLSRISENVGWISFWILLITLAQCARSSS